MITIIADSLFHVVVDRQELLMQQFPPSQQQHQQQQISEYSSAVSVSSEVSGPSSVLLR
jgi:hypothetical protein